MREKFFYDNVNKKIGRICPEVYVVDGTREHYEKSYCIMEYIEGTPLNHCFNSFDATTKNEVLYKIGEIAALINNIEIASNHSYITERGAWEVFVAGRLRERLTVLIKNEVISQIEIDKIADNIQRKKMPKTISFLHLDIRHVNMIYNNGNIFVLDAENCEFGDPLFELAVIDMGGELDSLVIDGYKNAYNGNIDLDSELYYYYKIERAALVLDMFMNIVKSDMESTRNFLNIFNETKNKLLG